VLYYVAVNNFKLLQQITLICFKLSVCCISWWLCCL